MITKRRDNLYELYMKKKFFNELQYLNNIYGVENVVQYFDGSEIYACYKIKVNNIWHSYVSEPT